MPYDRLNEKIQYEIQFTQQTNKKFEGIGCTYNFLFYILFIQIIQSYIQRILFFIFFLSLLCVDQLILLTLLKHAYYIFIRHKRKYEYDIKKNSIILSTRVSGHKKEGKGILFVVVESRRAVNSFQLYTSIPANTNVGRPHSKLQ